MSGKYQTSDHILTVFAFLGSATFMALFFLLQFKEKIDLYAYILPIIAISSILFILAAVGRLNINSGNIGTDTHYALVVGSFGAIGFFLILLSIVLLIAQANPILGVIVGVCALTCYGMLEITARRSNR